MPSQINITQGLSLFGAESSNQVNNYTGPGYLKQSKNTKKNSFKKSKKSISRSSSNDDPYGMI
jgi:hypothetical protein